MDKRMEKIQALLAKAESTTHPEEAKTFTAKAYELMEKWSIDEAMLRNARPADSIDVVTVRMEMEYSPYLSMKRSLLTGVTRAFDVKAIFTGYTRKGVKGKERYVNYVQLFGLARDVEFAQMMYTSLLLQADTEFLSFDVQQALAYETSHPGHRIKWRNTWMLGYTSAVIAKLETRKRTVRTEAENATPGVGLVLASKKERIEAHVEQTIGKTHTIRSNGGFAGGSAYGSGVAAGRRANVGDALGGKSTRGEVKA